VLWSRGYSLASDTSAQSGTVGMETVDNMAGSISLKTGDETPD